MKDLEAIRQESLVHLGFGIPSMKNARICKSCGAIGSAGQNFCNTCGQPLPEETVYQQYRAMHRHCGECGTVVAESCGYCPNCGARQRK